MNSFFLWMDSNLIWFFRIIDIPILGYYLGTSVVCLFCVMLGRLTLIMGSRINEKHLVHDHQNMVHMHNLSLYALVNKDKTAYQSCNKEANDAFGKVFFSQIALGASSLWPVPFALAWMQYRFGTVIFDLPFFLPGIGDTVGFMFTFFPILILTYIACGRICNLRANPGILKNNPIHANVLELKEEKLLSLKELTAISSPHN